MKYILVIAFTTVSVILLFFLLGYMYLAIRMFIRRLRHHYLLRKAANLEYENAKLAYINLMIVRKRYHEAKFLDENEKNAIQSECIKRHEKYIKILSNTDNPEYIDYLPKEKQEELKEILSKPRYNLI